MTINSCFAFFKVLGLVCIQFTCAAVSAACRVAYNGLLSSVSGKSFNFLTAFLFFLEYFGPLVKVIF